MLDKLCKLCKHTGDLNCPSQRNILTKRKAGASGKSKTKLTSGRVHLTGKEGDAQDRMWLRETRIDTSVQIITVGGPQGQPYHGTGCAVGWWI